MVAILFFKVRPNFFTDMFFLAINILCQYGENIFINESDIKVRVKLDERTLTHTE